MIDKDELFYEFIDFLVMKGYDEGEALLVYASIIDDHIRMRKQIEADIFVNYDLKPRN